MVQFEHFFRVHDANPYFHVFDPNSLALFWRQIETNSSHSSLLSDGGQDRTPETEATSNSPQSKTDPTFVIRLYPAENTINMDMNSIQQLRHHLPEFTLNIPSCEPSIQASPNDRVYF